MIQRVGLSKASRPQFGGEVVTDQPTTIPAPPTPETGAKEVGKSIGKSVLMGLLTSLGGPLVRVPLAAFNKDFREDLKKEWKADYGTSGPLPVLLQALNKLQWIVSMIANLAGWVALITALIAFYPPAAPIALGISSIAGFIAMICAAFVGAAKLIFVARDLWRLHRYSKLPAARASIKAQLWRDLGGLIGAAIQIPTAGLIPGIPGGGTFLEGPSKVVTDVTAQAPKVIGAGLGVGAGMDMFLNTLGGVTGYKEGTVRPKLLPGVSASPLAIMREGEETQGVISPTELQARSQLLAIANELAEVSGGRVSQTAEQRAGLVEGLQTANETESSYTSKLKPFEQVKDKGEEVQQQVSQAEQTTESPPTGMDKNTATRIEQRLARGERDAERDPASIKESEIQQLVSEAKASSGSTQPPKRGILSRIGHTIASWFVNIKNRVKKLLAKVRAKMLQLVLKAAGGKETMAQFEQVMAGAKSATPLAITAKGEEHDAAAAVVPMAETIKKLVSGGE